MGGCEAHLHRRRPAGLCPGGVGTGLGVWVSYEIIMKHHGLVHVRSRTAARGKSTGTVFQVFIPDDPDLMAAASQAPAVV